MFSRVTSKVIVKLTAETIIESEFLHQDIRQIASIVEDGAET